MVFGVAELICFAPQLHARAGRRDPHRHTVGLGGFLDRSDSGDGDVVGVEIEGIGTLRNPVVEVGAEAEGRLTERAA